MPERPPAVLEAAAGDVVWGAPRRPAAVLASVRAAAVASDGADPLDEATELLLKHRGQGGTRRLWTAGEAGFALMLDSSLTVVVRPDRRGVGIGRELIGAALSAGTGKAPITAWSHADHPAAARLAAGFGFARVRELWVMRRPTALPVAGGTVPEGVGIRGYRPSDAGDVVRVNGAAFADHPEQGAMDADNLAARMAEPWFDPAGLLVAEDDSGILGFHWTKRHPGTDLGEVYVVGLAPAAQGRGLGTALTAAGLRHLAADPGVREVLLYVESDNAPALALYRRLGFTHEDRDTHVMYRR